MLLPKLIMDIHTVKYFIMYPHPEKDKTSESRCIIKNGLLCGIADYDNEKKLLSTTEYLYDEKERLNTEVKKLFADGTKKQFNYAYEDNKIEVTWIDSEGKNIREVYSDFDKYGNWQTSETFSDDISTEKYKRNIEY